jgi:predicted nucleic acid-binding protein
MTRVADRVFLDTNVLLAATDEGRAEHAAALAALDEWPRAGTTLYTSGQVIREYLSVATRPVQSNGLGLARVDALSNARALYARLQSLDENRKVTERLLVLLDDVECTGKQVHDANIVGTMLAHGIDVLVTLNTDDFVRFARYVRIVSPERLA